MHWLWYTDIHSHRLVISIGFCIFHYGRTSTIHNQSSKTFYPFFSSFYYNGTKLLAKDPMQYSRRLLDILFTKVDQQGHVISATAQSQRSLSWTPEDSKDYPGSSL